MGRPAGEPQLRLRSDGLYTVRFTHRGRRYELSTRTRDAGEAPVVARSIYERIAHPRELAVPGVYALLDGAYVKIGKASRSIRDRARNLQTGHPVPLTIRMLSRNPKDEARIHAALAPHRVRGEWFRLNGEVLAHLNRLEATL